MLKNGYENQTNNFVKKLNSINNSQQSNTNSKTITPNLNSNSYLNLKSNTKNNETQYKIDKTNIDKYINSPDNININDCAIYLSLNVLNIGYDYFFGLTFIEFQDYIGNCKKIKYSNNEILAMQILIKYKSQNSFLHQECSHLLMNQIKNGFTDDVNGTNEYGTNGNEMNNNINNKKINDKINNKIINDTSTFANKKNNKTNTNVNTNTNTNVNNFMLNKIEEIFVLNKKDNTIDDVIIDNVADFV